MRLKKFHYHLPTPWNYGTSFSLQYLPTKTSAAPFSIGSKQQQQALRKPPTQTEQRKMPMPMPFRHNPSSTEPMWRVGLMGSPHKLWKQKRDEQQMIMPIEPDQLTWRQMIPSTRPLSLPSTQKQQGQEVNRIPRAPQQEKVRYQTNSQAIQDRFAQLQSRFNWSQQMDNNKPAVAVQTFHPEKRYPYHEGSQGRLLDEQHEFRKIRNQMREDLFKLYVEENGSPNTLDNVLKWAKKMRMIRLDDTPLLHLIDRVQHYRDFRHLIPPLYKAFMNTDETQLYINRAELWIPAIVQAFMSENPIDEVHSLCQKINCSLQRFKSTERTQALGYNLKRQFIHYIYKISENMIRKNNFGTSAIHIQDMATALRQSGCYPSPLVDAIDHVLGFDGAHRLGYARALHLYRAFLQEPDERKIYENRPHVILPWILAELLRKNKLFRYDRMPIIYKLFQLYTDPKKQGQLPDFLFQKMVVGSLNHLFGYLCAYGQFEAAQRIWNYSEKHQIKLVIYPTPLLLFSMYHWINGRHLEAEIVKQRMQNRVQWLRKKEKRLEQELQHGGIRMDYMNRKDKKDRLHGYKTQINVWKIFCDRFNEINQSYRQLATNPQTNDRERAKYSRIYQGVMHDIIMHENGPMRRTIPDEYSLFF